MSRPIRSAFAPIRISVLALALPLSFRAAETASVQLTVQGLPPGTSEVVVVFDAGAAPAPNYNEPAAPAAAPVAPAAAAVQQVLQQVQPPGAAAPAAPADGAGAGRRRRFGGANAAAALPPPTRSAVAVKGETTATLSATVPAAENYQARVIALSADPAFPSILASGRIADLKFKAKDSATLDVSLRAPELKLAADSPKSVKAGAHYTLTGTITDAAHALGSKTRMRVWISDGAALRANYSGTQTSTVEVTSKGDDATFTFDLVAPPHATTLYYQFGEIPTDFTRGDGQQAPFLVVPDFSTGATPLTLRVE